MLLLMHKNKVLVFLALTVITCGVQWASAGRVTDTLSYLKSGATKFASSVKNTFSRQKPKTEASNSPTLLKTQSDANDPIKEPEWNKSRRDIITNEKIDDPKQDDRARAKQAKLEAKQKELVQQKLKQQEQEEHEKQEKLAYIKQMEQEESQSKFARWTKNASQRDYDAQRNRIATWGTTERSSEARRKQFEDRVKEFNAKFETKGIKIKEYSQPEWDANKGYQTVRKKNY